MNGLKNGQYLPRGCRWKMISSHRYLITTIFFPFFFIYVSVVFLREIFNYKFKKSSSRVWGIKLVMDNRIFLCKKKIREGSMGWAFVNSKKYDLFSSRGTRVLVLFLFFFFSSSSPNWWRKNFVLTRGRNKKINKKVTGA